MLGLPQSTQVDRRIPKEKLYLNADLTPQVRDSIKDHIEAIIWRNKLAESTLGVSSGETIEEIEVFEVLLRQKSVDKRVLSAIAQAIPYKILFISTFSGEAQAWIEVSDTFYNTAWLALDDFTIRLEGLNLDSVYENLVRHIAGGRLDSEGDLANAVNRDKERQKLELEISALEKKILHEKQFNRQVELNSELKKLKIELEKL